MSAVPFKWLGFHYHFPNPTVTWVEILRVVPVLGVMHHGPDVGVDGGVLRQVETDFKIRIV